MILITGGCGFIGANYIIYTLNKSKEPLVNLDKLTYAAVSYTHLTLPTT